jgi:hypothetical protein
MARAIRRWLPGKLLLIASLAGSPLYAAPAKKPAPAPVKHVTISADAKKKLAENLSGFKFGMTKDDVIAALSKQLDDKYNTQISSTTDIAVQDRLRRDKKKELADIQASYVQFDGKRTGWDVSVVEDEFVHHTDESMVVRWENSNGKNNRRFFFFYQGKLWKMFISLDVSILPAGQQNFDTFKNLFTSSAQYGPGDVDVGKILWHTDEFDVRALDKLKTYGALGLSIEDWKMEKDVLAMRASKAPENTGTSPIVNSMVDKDNTDHPNVKQNGDAVDAVINANGGKK